ncbi:facilitated trehalose transporter Tret1-2 homolog [Neodiprion virginianus]|uniref:facilitated trehalose transporter Tret1-2 homolog n=1 Tax=Neodiprion virginianus TaxID=2961670 RepID=UPI001EE6D9AF|nr:facilitated trehalose transporter Tret1-2 homolog [Neodiprion virginianus]
MEDENRNDRKTDEAKQSDANSSAKEVSGRSHLLRQTLTAIGPIMSTISVGATFGYSAVLLPQLKPDSAAAAGGFGRDLNASSVFWLENKLNDYDRDHRITTSSLDDESWIAASAALLMAPGCWLSGILMERLGRRVSQILVSPAYLIAWATVGFAPNFTALIVGRLLSGLCVGLQGPLGPVYVAETSEPRMRGILLAGISLAIAVGILISHVLGTWFSWRVAAHLCAGFPVLSLLACVFAPESPSWLVKKKRISDATNAWLYLRGKNAAAEFRALEYRSSETPENSTTGGAVWNSRTFLAPLAILNVFFFVQQFSGVNAVAFYCVQLIADVSEPADNRNAHYATLVLDVVRVVASFFACWLTRRCGRRGLALVSGAGTASSLFVLGGGLLFGLGTPWLPGSMLVVFVFLVSVGLVPLPWLLCGEIFPVAARGLGSGLSSGFAFVCFFIVVKTGPAMTATLSNPGTFLLYGSLTAAGTVFLYFFLPETKDKTLQDIEDHFLRNRNAPAAAVVATSNTIHTVGDDSMKESHP